MVAASPAGSVSRLPLVAAAGLIVALLFYLGGQPFAAGLIVPPWDKLAHFAIYATITLLLYLGVGGRWPWALVLVVAAVGALDEWRQMGIPGRTADLGDLLVDIAAAVFVVGACTCRKARRMAH